LLESYLAKYREATARDSIGAASADARVISTAIVSNTPAWPKKLPTVLIAALGTLALSCGFVLSGELLSAANVRPAALPLESSPVESAPAIRLDNSRMAGGVPLAAIEELAHTLGSEGARRVTVLGTAPSMNTPLVAIALARTLAKRARVALVDLALATPSLLAIATDRNAPGIGDLVEGTVSFGQIVSRDRYSSVHVVTAGRTTAAPAEIIGSHRLAIALEALARSYDHVLVIADALPEISAEQFVQLAPRGVLVVANPDDPAATVARTQLLAAGFTDVSVLSGRTAQAAEERAAA
jgi:Mrp family chromosome partitioning ATPase